MVTTEELKEKPLNELLRMHKMACYFAEKHQTPSYKRELDTIQNFIVENFIKKES